MQETDITPNQAKCKAETNSIVINQHINSGCSLITVEAYAVNNLFDSSAALRIELSEHFAVNGNASVFTADYNAQDGSFGKEHRFSSAIIDASEKTVCVSGFDYAEHCCSDCAANGMKLTVRIPVQITADRVGKYPVLSAASGIYGTGGECVAAISQLYAYADSLIDLSENLSSTPCLDKLWTWLFGKCNKHQNLWPTMSSLRKIGKDIYLLDYQYEYNIDDLMKKGAASAAALVKYAARHIWGGSMKVKPSTCALSCSAFEAHNENGEHIMGRNFDYLDSPCYVLWTHPENAYSSIAMVDGSFMFTTDHLKHRSTVFRKQCMLSPYLCLDGMNEKGFAISVLQIHENGTKQDTGKTKMFTTAILRCCLDKCASVEEAIELFKCYDIQDTVAFGYSLGCCFHYMLTDANGDAAVIEYVNNEIRIIRADKPELQRLFVTNYYLSEDGGAGSEKYDPEGMERWDMIKETLAKNNNVLNLAQTFDLLSDVHLNYRHDNNLYDITTLWSCMYNNTQRTMSLAARMDYTKIYTFDINKPLKVLGIDSIEVSTPIEGIGLR